MTSERLSREQRLDVAGLFPRTCAYCFDFLLSILITYLIGNKTWGFWLFFFTITGFEVSRWRASPGKLIMGLRLHTNAENAHVAIVIRNFAKIASHILLLGFMPAVFNRSRRTWHDRVAGTTVVERKDLDVSPLRRAFSFSLFMVAVGLVAGGLLFQKFAPYFSGKSLGQFINNWNSSDLNSAVALKILEGDHGIILPLDYQVIKARNEIDRYGFHLKIALGKGKYAGKIHLETLSIPELVDRSNVQPLLVFIASRREQSSIAGIKSQLSAIAINQQTVMHRSNNRTVKSVRYFVEVNGGVQKQVIYLTELTPDLLLLYFASEKDFNLNDYLSVFHVRRK